MLSEDLKEWSFSVEELYNNVKKFISDNKLPDIVDFEVVSNRKGLYNAYGKIVNINNKISEFQVSVNQMLMIKSKFKKSVKSIGYSSQVTTFNNYIEEISERVNITDKMLSSYKNGVENQLRFYQSVQYILSSPRLGLYD